MWGNMDLVLVLVLMTGAVMITAVPMNAIDAVMKQPRICHPPQTFGKPGLVQVECEGLRSLLGVKDLLGQDLWSKLAFLTISNSIINDNLTLDHLVEFPALHTLTLNTSRLMEWREPQLQSAPKVKTLVLKECWDNDIIIAKSMQLTISLTSQLLAGVPALEELHIINNYIRHLGNLTTSRNFHRVIVIGGAIKCERENLWLLEWHDADKAVVNSTVCYVVEKTKDGLVAMHTMFSFTQKDFLMVMRYWQKTLEGCLAPCTCNIGSIKDNLQPIIIVNCSSSNLAGLPDVIPEKTTNLLLSNNKISDFSKMFTNPLYQYIAKIDLEHNHIQHMDGNLFVKYSQSRSLDFSIRLAHNKIEMLPVKQMKKVYNEADRKGTKNLPSFTLGNNPWNCDECDFLVDFQTLVFYLDSESDNYDVRCGEGRYSGGQQIIKLPVRDFCKVDPPLQPLDILNICLGVLLFLFILNFLHNFVRYRRHGQLPWIVTKVPCC